MVIVVGLFVVTQAIFLATYIALGSIKLDSLIEIPGDVNRASKLLVYPNLKLASLFLPVDEKILNRYSATVS